MANSIVSGKNSPAEVDLTSPQTLTTKTINASTIGSSTVSASSIQSPTRLDVKKDTAANLATYASSADEGQLCWATDTDKLFVIKSSALVELNKDVVACHVNSFASQTTSQSVVTLVDASSVQYDSHSAFSTATNLYTVPVTGIYEVTTRVQFRTTNANITNTWFTQIRRDSTTIQTSFRHGDGANTGGGLYYMDITSSAIISATSGQTLSVYAYHDVGVGTNGFNADYITIKKIN
jgi:hypothetical protein